MRLIKAQNSNLRNIYGRGVKFDVNDQVVMDTTNVLMVPKGTEAQRPDSPANGHFRYNTDSNEFEAYQNGAWRKARFKEPTSIVQQNLATGDAIETIFGPLDSGDADYTVPDAAQNILVFVENVFQLATTNYTLVQNPGNQNSVASIVSVGLTTVIQTATNHGFTTADQIYISGVESDIDDNLENLNTDDSSSPGSHNIVSIPAANQIEVGVDTTGANIANYTAGTGIVLKAGTSTGAYTEGTYIQFTSAPDLDKPVTVLHNFDK